MPANHVVIHQVVFAASLFGEYIELRHPVTFFWGSMRLRAEHRAG
jgi:hypothetical protein